MFLLERLADAVSKGGGSRGIRDAEEWLHWYEPRDMATLSVAVCEEKGKGGLEVKAWREDFELATDA
jgi:hypothetical protein